MKTNKNLPIRNVQLPMAIEPEHYHVMHQAESGLTQLEQIKNVIILRHKTLLALK